MRRAVRPEGIMRHDSNHSKRFTQAKPRIRSEYTVGVKQLAAKTLLGLTNLLMFAALALFGPAWTLRYWQAWLYLLVFGAATLIITIDLWRRDPALLARRVKGGPIAEARKSQQSIQAFSSAAFLALLIVPSLDHRFGWSRVPLAFVLASDLLVALGFYIVFAVFRVNTFTASTVEVAENQTVVSTGPYAFVRHPMYAGALIMLLATPPALGSWWGLLAFPAMLAAIVVRLIDEERLLCATLSGYAEYAARVRHRLLPFVW